MPKYVGLRTSDEKPNADGQRQLELEAAERRRIHQLCVERLDDQLRRWRTARDIRDFATAAADGDDPDRIVWLTWATTYADSIDPFVAGVGPPEIPEPAPRG